MTVQELQERLIDFVLNHPENAIQASYALRPELIGTPFYDAPLLGCAASEDPLFLKIQQDPVILGPMFRLPEQWLPGAKSVLSFFLPYTKEIRDSNRDGLEAPSDQWLHGRIEGQEFLLQASRQLAKWLQEAGYDTIIPAEDPAFCTDRNPNRQALGRPVFTSSWSERHVAFTAGLGTFSLTKHIITEKGVCGRFGSVITTAPLTPTPRPYTDPYEYCTNCGACTHRCPANAISIEEGKNILTCAEFMDINKATYAPRFGCGKCQLAVPCTTRIPRRS